MTIYLYLLYTQSWPLLLVITVTISVLKARSVQLKAVVISERVLGFDHPNTIQQYVSIATHFPQISFSLGMTKLEVPRLEIKPLVTVEKDMINTPGFMATDSHRVFVVCTLSCV